jgi:hypothetical protein
MKNSATIILFSLATATAPLWGQTFDSDYHPSEEAAEETAAPENDQGVFSTPVWEAANPFRDFSRFRFGAVKYRERGLDNNHFRVTLGGVELTNNLSSYPDWNLITLSRHSGLAVSQGQTGTGRAENYSPAPGGDKFYVALRAGDRYSRAGGDIRLGRAAANGWAWTLAATGRGGNDGHFTGVYSDEGGATASLAKKWAGGATLTLFAAGGVSERGSRTAATAETFSLTGDNFYNPVWGLQGGKTRNSRTTRARYLFAAAELSVPLGNRNTLSLTLATRRNKSGRTRLAWYDAHSPLPDYYRSMPSALPDWEAMEAVTDAWHRRDPAVTQIDWAGLYYNNTLAPDGRATYIVEEQVEAASDLHLNIAVERRVAPTLEISYGVRARLDNSRFYKLASDMLGAEWVANVDQYITDDDGEPHTTPPNENDLRNPGRRVRQGERLGYDYRMTRLMPSAFGEVGWNGDRGGVTASASMTHTRLQREGFYEKELFPGTASFGRSPALDFTTWSLAASGWIDAGAGHSFSLSLSAATEAPRADDIFLSPRQNNFCVTGVAPSGLYGAEVAWAFGGGVIDLRLGSFVNSTVGETQVRQYYDDLASRFTDMVTRGVDRLGYGVEAGVEVRPARWLTLAAGASLGRYRYNSEPVATLHEDETGEVFSRDVVCYMSGLSTGLPSHVAGWEVTVADRQYLRFSLSGEWFGGRAVEINPLFHSSRVTGINSAPEIMRRFTEQERLPDAFTLGVALSKGWSMGRGYLRLAGSVRNLLGATIIHSAFEQMRIRRLGSGLDRTLVPAPPKYLYAYPRTWSVTLSYRL